MSTQVGRKRGIAPALVTQSATRLPATHLPGGDDPVAIEVAADLLIRLHRARATSFPFPALEETHVHLEDQARDNAAYERRARHALQQ
jgi:hypothetical protein